MRYKDIIKESMYQPLPDFEDDEDLVKFLKKHCGEWISETGAEMAWRGASPENKPKYGFIGTTRKDRKPRDSSQVQHDFFNQVIAKAGGTANRSNSIFVTSDDGISEMYGETYAFFAIGDYHYTWSPELEDWTQFLSHEYLMTHYQLDDEEEDIIHKYQGHPSAQVAALAKEKPEGRDFLFNIDKYDYKFIKEHVKVDKNLSEALYHGNEIMVQCEKYIMLPQYIAVDISEIL